MPEGVEVSSRVSGRRIDNMLPGRQGRLLFAYLALSRLRPVSRSTLVDALWGDDQPANIGGALNALISKTRAVVGGQVLRGRSELILALPGPASVDVEVALSMVHAAESAVAVGAWRRAWSPAGYLALANIGNGFYTVYVISLSLGPIWALSGAAEL